AVAHYSEDNIYVGDGEVGRIRRIDRSSGIIDSVAGCGLPGYSGDGGPARRARIGSPSAIRFDASGNLYFTDSTCHVIRRVDRQGRIATVAGSGEAGYSPDGTPALKARLRAPGGLAVGRDGTLYFSDRQNHRVRRITRNGLLETVAGCGEGGDSGDGGPATASRLNEPLGLCLCGDDLLFISDHYNNRIRAVRLPAGD
ncbi:MAG: hypothetical protein OXI92_18490, partial [Acidobacteriota bacterium]|nr:hypothetical protein [Acidobacteriota bacterium]